jgi:hypothetical protein
MPSNKYKKLKQPTFTNKRKNKLKFKEFEKIVSGLTEEELNLVGDWLLNQPQNSSGQ